MTASYLSQMLGFLPVRLTADWLAAVEEAPALHLAVMVEPYLTLLLNGKKTIESRFSKVKSAPYEQAQANDVVFLKKAAGSVVGLFRVDAVEFIELSPTTWPGVKERGAAICAGPGFWEERADKRYASLLFVGPVKRVIAFDIPKADRQPWALLRGPR